MSVNSRPRKLAEKFTRNVTVAPEFFLSCPSTFLGSTGAISRFGERFSDGQYSLVSFLFAFLLPTVPPCLAICKSEGTRAPSPDPYRVGATVCDCFPQNLQSMGWFVVQQGNEQARGAFD